LTLVSPGEKKDGIACFEYVLPVVMPTFVLPVLLKILPRTELAKLEGVQAVIGTSEFAQIGQPTPQQNRRRANLCLAAGPK
jgi:hypothetical protein